MQSHEQHQVCEVVGDAKALTTDVMARGVSGGRCDWVSMLGM